MANRQELPGSAEEYFLMRHEPLEPYAMDRRRLSGDALDARCGLERRARRPVLLAGMVILDDLGVGKESGRLSSEAHRERGTHRKVRDDQHADVALARLRFDRRALLGAPAAGADDRRQAVRDGRGRDLVASRLGREIEQDVGVARKHLGERIDDAALAICNATEAAAGFARAFQRLARDRSHAPHRAGDCYPYRVSHAVPGWVR